MMVSAILGWILFAITLTVSWIAFKDYLAFRSMSNKFLALASREFHEASSSLISADYELPESVIHALDLMNKTACSGRGHWHLLKLLRMARKSEGSRGPGSTDLVSQVNSMRPELIELFDRTATGWLKYISNRNVFVHVLILLEFYKLQSRSGKLKPASAKERLSVLAHFEMSGPARTMVR